VDDINTFSGINKYFDVEISENFNDSFHFDRKKDRAFSFGEGWHTPIPPSTGST
jgi:hypothetical protein